MSETAPVWVFAYDVADDRRRARIAESLKDVGVRVNKSVFECRLSKAAAQRLAQRLAAALKRGDHLRVYRLCESCRAEVGVFGPSAEANPTVEVV